MGDEMNVKIHMVGGAVRDMLMGIEPKDIDYVVVGANPDHMVNVLGMSQVGQDFPVFLDKNGDEYALARKEISTGDKYTDFKFEWDGVTLEEDLYRRDLTINAISMQKMEDTEFFVSGDEGSFAVFDPYGGQDDIHHKIFRPVSDHFMEDPVRVLRVARLRARYGAEWKLAPELVAMCSTMSKKGKMNVLDPNRIWKELSRALMEPNPRLFFDTLLQLDCLHTVFPEIYRLLSATESYRWHPEGNAYEHTMLVLTQAAVHGFDLTSRYAALVHDIGKGLTPLDKLPSHFGHDVNGAKMLEEFSKKYSVPTRMVKLAKFATRYHMYMHKLHELNAKTVVAMFDEIRRDREYVEVLYNVGVCDERGRLGSEKNNIAHVFKIWSMFDAYMSVSYGDHFSPDDKPKPEQINNVLTKARIHAVKNADKNQVRLEVSA